MEKELKYYLFQRKHGKETTEIVVIASSYNQAFDILAGRYCSALEFDLVMSHSAEGVVIVL